MTELEEAVDRKVYDCFHNGDFHLKIFQLYSEKDDNGADFIALNVFKDMDVVFPDLFRGRQTAPASFYTRRLTPGSVAYSIPGSVWDSKLTYVSWPISEGIRIFPVCEAMAERLKQLASPGDFHPELLIPCMEDDPESMESTEFNCQLTARLEQDDDVSIWFTRPDANYYEQELVSLVGK